MRFWAARKLCGKKDKNNPGHKNGWIDDVIVCGYLEERLPEMGERKTAQRFCQNNYARQPLRLMNVLFLKEFEQACLATGRPFYQI